MRISVENICLRSVAWACLNLTMPCAAAGFEMLQFVGRSDQTLVTPSAQIGALEKGALSERGLKTLRVKKVFKNG